MCLIHTFLQGWKLNHVTCSESQKPNFLCWLTQTQLIFVNHLGTDTRLRPLDSVLILHACRLESIWVLAYFSMNAVLMEKLWLLLFRHSAKNDMYFLGGWNMGFCALGVACPLSPIQMLGNADTAVLETKQSFWSVSHKWEQRGLGWVSPLPAAKQLMTTAFLRGVALAPPWLICIVGLGPLCPLD